ncbi:MAG: lipopolysaccharide transport periplasmic protein LptA [Candidatus Deferrimicrobiaceae bacterium]
MRGQTTRLRNFARVAARGVVFLLLFLVMSVPAGAEEKPGAWRSDEAGRQPIEITADRLNADSGTESVTFEGNVVANQADVTLHADRLFAEYSRGQKAIEKITAEGNVRVVQGGKEARAAHAVFYNLEQRIVLSGGADLKQGENTLKGDTVTIYLRENRSVVTSGEGGRVRAVLHPQGLVQGKEKESR